MADPKTLQFAIVAVDTVLFTFREGRLHVLCIPVTIPPHFLDCRGLPGGLIAPDETAEDAVVRHLSVKGGIKSVAYSEQLHTFSAIDRDPRGRVVAIAYMALIPETEADRIAPTAKWFFVDALPKMAYDHEKIIAYAVERLKGKLSYTNIAYGLLPKEFTLAELLTCYESVLDRKLDKRNFIKKNTPAKTRHRYWQTKRG
ncbi:MAG: NUDIX domain protein [Microgenomates bacterium OLB22]|nr:MAG: NUDIX domain protein [Microgenomates bacterium OLB22]